MQEELLTVEETAKILRSCKATVLNYIKGGKLKAGFFGKSYKISKTELQKFLTEHNIEISLG